jgi:hypothetical protein
MPMAMYMKGDRPFSVFLFSKPGIVFLHAIAVLPIVCAVIIHQYRASASSRSSTRRFRWIVMINLVIMTLVLSTLEIIIRENSVPSKEGETFVNRVLLPKDWEKVALHHRELIEGIGHGSGPLSYMVNDDLLGWTVAPNNGGGLYWSSSEGIRAPLNDGKPVNLTGSTPIALLGDSVTFGQEVAYEDTWGYFLEKALGSQFRVLNFGVGGYAVDQAYLRYEKDARKWNPKVVIYGFMAHAVVRTMMVYPFISLPNLDFPFSKPRFTLRDGDLKTVNVPALPPETIFSKESISDLPFLDYDAGYKQSEWQRRLYHFSYLARLCVSKFGDWSAVNPDVSDDALVSVNTSILRSFVRSVDQSGAILIVVYFPQTQELDRPNSSLPIGKRVLDEANIDYIDMTPCLLRLKPGDRVVPSGAHYSSQGNAAIANCLLPVVNQAMAASRSTATARKTGRRT